MLSVRATYIDGELYRTVNTELYSQFKYLSIKGAAVSPIFCVDSMSVQRPPAQAPGPSQLSSKHFPSQRSNHLPSDRPLGPQTQGQVQRRVQGEAGRDVGRARENDWKVGEKVEECDSKGAGVGLEGVRQAGVSETWGRAVAAKEE